MNAREEDRREPDGEGFDRSKVPDGPLADYFYDGRTGRGISNEEWDEQRRRLREHDDDPFAKRDDS